MTLAESESTPIDSLIWCFPPVYDWMVKNVPDFADKGDSTSSAGWKVGCVGQNSFWCN